jgi:hypothetical protein
MKHLSGILIIFLLTTLVACTDGLPIAESKTPDVLPTSYSVKPTLIHSSSVGQVTPTVGSQSQVAVLGMSDMDSGLFSETSCKIPCWQNLIPGQSTIEDANRFADSLDKEEWPERHSLIYESGCEFVRLSGTSNNPSNSKFETRLWRGLDNFQTFFHKKE